MPDFVIGGGPFLAKKDSAFRADLFLHDGTAAVTGKVNGDFTKLLCLNGAADGSAVTVTEVNAATRAGVYTITFTPTAVGHYSLYVHEGNADGGQMWDIESFTKNVDDLAAIQYDCVGGVTYDAANDDLNITAFLLKDGQIVPGATSVTVKIFPDSAVELFTVTDAAPDANGVFRMTKNAPGLVEGETHSAQIAILNGAVTYTAIVPVLVQEIS